MRFLNKDEFVAAVKKAKNVWVYVEFDYDDGDYIPIKKPAALSLLTKGDRFNVTFGMGDLYIGGHKRRQAQDERAANTSVGCSGGAENMKRCVSITLTVDPKEYHKAKDSPKGAIDLVVAMLRNQADWPSSGITLACEDAAKKLGPDGLP